MSTTVHVRIKTKEDSFDQMAEYVKSDLHWTREYEGCHSIHCSMNREMSMIGMCEVWDSEDAFMAYFAKRGERSGDKFEQWLVEDGVSFEFSETVELGLGPDYQKRG